MIDSGASSAVAGRVRPLPSPATEGHPPGRPRTLTAALFAGVGLSGLVVNQLLLWSLVSLGKIHYLVAAVLATQGSTTWNFLLNDRWVFAGAKDGSRAKRFLGFAAVNNAALLLRVPLLALLTSVLAIHYLISNLITLVLLFVSRFMVSDRLIWKSPEGGKDAALETAHAPSGADAAPVLLLPSPEDPGNGRADALIDLTPRPALPSTSGSKPAVKSLFGYRYDVHGFVSIASDIRLKELEYFRVSAPAGGADIEIRVGPVGDSKPRARVSVLQAPGHVAYQEHLGRMGANFSLDISDRITVTAGPLLARSPHVLYTNVVEALLRFVLASRGRILLHAATVETDGHGLMLSARTDTGKTGTVLRLLQSGGTSFLADDMTILDPTGTAFAYPKPLTISAHTLRAVNRRALGARERMALAVQSRIHSKGGRSMGQQIAEMNLPIMALNALTQIVVPPPKYAVTRLVPCEVATSTKVSDLFLIERGRPALETIENGAAVQALIENTDDAYGFPPFRSFAPAIAIGGEDYISLRAKEREILGRALENVLIRRLVRDDFSWAEAIPHLLRAQRGFLGTTPIDHRAGDGHKPEVDTPAVVSLTREGRDRDGEWDDGS